MAKRNLTTQTMVTVSERWVDPEREKPILQRYPLTAALIPHLVKAHTNLVVFQRASAETQGEIAAVQKEQAALDAEHDRKIRGVFSFLTSLAELSDTEGRARHYLDLRDKLLPDGLRAVQRSYVDQAGEIVLLEGRLDDGAKRALADIGTPEGPLSLHVQAWMKAATRLGQLEEKRLDLARSASIDDTRKSDVLRARNEWIRVVNGLKSNLLLDQASDEDLYRIFRHLDAAEAKADRRSPSEPSNLADAPPAPSAEPEPCAQASSTIESDSP